MDNFEIIEDLSEFNRWTQSYRYKTYHAQRDGKEYLVKFPQDETHRRMIKNEVRFREFFKNVEMPHVSCTSIEEETEEYIAFEWIDDASLLCERAGPYDDFEDSIGRYAVLLAAMDDAAEDYTPTGDDSKAVSAHTKNNMTQDELLIDLRDHIAAGYVSESDIDVFVREYQNSSAIEKRYQHGDMAPWHIFVDDVDWLLFDAEHANSTKPRFHDLAHTYARFAAICHRPDLARRTLHEFIDAHGSFNHREKQQFMRVMVGQSFGELINAYNDRESIHYRNQSRELFDAVKSLEIGKLQ